MFIATPTVAQDCPVGWFEFSDVCYNFVFRPERTFQEAVIACDQGASALLSVRSLDDHTFVQGWLKTHDAARSGWLTSGYRDNAGTLIWDSDGSIISKDYFLDSDSRNGESNRLVGQDYSVIVYKYIGSTSEYVWSWERSSQPSSYICQMNRTDGWKLYQNTRDFSYGSNISDPNLWEVGPNITYLSQDTVFYKVDGQVTTVMLDCVATGNPRPTYRNSEEEVTSDTSSRYGVTSGRLVITDPDPVVDSSWYSCVVSNKLGTAVSSYIEVSYGYLGQFSNVQQGSVLATMYMGKELTCQAPPHNTDQWECNLYERTLIGSGYCQLSSEKKLRFYPTSTNWQGLDDLSYNWFKSGFNFIRPELNSQYFMSRGGSFYISEVQVSDQYYVSSSVCPVRKFKCLTSADEYFCMVFMKPQSGHILSGTQPPTRTSLATELRVSGENANTYGPDVHDKFPQVFPDVPMAGGIVEIECLAYGRLPLTYSWVREDAPLHPNTYFNDHNRVLVIPSARLEDTGSYTCVVKGERNTANKTVHLGVKARPYFPFPLRHQHVDAGSRLTWTCHAIGVPKPVYTWYKNGVPLTTNQGPITVIKNFLVIDPVQLGQHEGVYQCQAVNDFGSARSTAQLRVLYFAPTFMRTPLQSFIMASVGGNITIPCQPEAAPKAQIKWLKNGVEEVGGVLPSGALHLSGLSVSDSGNYTCVASNDLGEARSTCLLNVQGTAVFTQLPSNVEVENNGTALLNCKASFDEGQMDVVYFWKFYSHVLDMSAESDDKTHYWMSCSTCKDYGTLYIINAQFRHEGEYTCVVSTAAGVLTASAYVTVKGPPGEPGGVHVRRGAADETFSADQVVLWWQDGQDHGYPATKYRIEYSSIFDQDWKSLKSDVPVQETLMDEFPNWRSLVITEGLSPGTSYRFRVQAGSDQAGYGPVNNAPYRWYTMASAPPTTAPENVGGGGGSVGILSITWNPMPRSSWGSSTIHYCVYYRRQSNQGDNPRWIKVDDIQVPSLYVVVGPDNYFLPYEVKVQGVNDLGRGPNSTVTVVYSAEDVPTNIAPTFHSANAINATAGTVTWIPVQNTREAARGTIVGYQVNYWMEDTKCLGKYELDGMSSNFYGDVSSGVLVGLDFSGDYCVNVQFYNNAGMGPKTDNYYMGMYDA
ncbi:hypothetical protein Btru_058046, partial [Bulinus truncatus]